MSDSKQLTISALRAQPALIEAEHGDLPIVLLDRDSGQPFHLQAPHLTVWEPIADHPARRLAIVYDWDAPHDSA